MSLPHIPGDRHVLTIRTFPEGDLQVNFAWHADACELLLEQAAMYSGRVTAFHATIAEHTEANGRRILHEVHWKADADEQGLHEFVRDSVRSDLVRLLLETAEQQLRTHAGTTSQVMRAEWGWDYHDEGPSLDDLPSHVRLADGTTFDDPYDLMDTCLYVVSDRFLLVSLLGLRTDDALIIYRKSNGTIVTSADPDFVDEPTLKATA